MAAVMERRSLIFRSDVSRTARAVVRNLTTASILCGSSNQECRQCRVSMTRLLSRVPRMAAATLLKDRALSAIGGAVREHKGAIEGQGDECDQAEEADHGLL